jgi:prevent-host-death family protein
MAILYVQMYFGDRQMPKSVAATEFKARCLNLIEQMGKDGEPVIVTKRGKPVAILSPIKSDVPPKSIIGALKGSVLRYEDPFSPVIDASEWDANR